jgi:DNA replication protein DnaC
MRPASTRREGGRPFFIAFSATIITSQLDPKNWHAVIGDETVADAICDRLVLGAQRIKLSGESLRKGLTNGKKPAK